MAQILMALILLTMLLGACSARSTPSTASADGDTITLAALPAGVGRGFPTAKIDRLDNRGADLDEGQAPPNFRLVLDDGRHLNLHDLHGRPILINFWATWCGPCRLEMPEIVAVTQANPDLIVLAVNVQETMEQIRPFAEEFQMQLPVIRDPDGELRTLYAVRGMPTSIFIDRDGKIFTIWAGMLTVDLLQKIVADLG
jgi:thiol-disulfide isomerase/thioredoxin